VLTARPTLKINSPIARPIFSFQFNFLPLLYFIQSYHSSKKILSSCQLKGNSTNDSSSSPDISASRCRVFSAPPHQLWESIDRLALAAPDSFAPCFYVRTVIPSVRLTSLCLVPPCPLWRSTLFSRTPTCNTRMAPITSLPGYPARPKTPAFWKICFQRRQARARAGSRYDSDRG